jgi:phosphoenolpyruvate synthase/pyruvate phosphate dikinase
MAIRTRSTAAAVALVHRLDELSRGDIPFAGGKGANLGKLTKAGFPVLPGFVVGVPAYARFCDEGDLRGRRLLDAAERRVLLQHARAGGDA